MVPFFSYSTISYTYFIFPLFSVVVNDRWEFRNPVASLSNYGWYWSSSIFNHESLTDTSLGFTSSGSNHRTQTVFINWFQRPALYEIIRYL